MHDCKTQFLHVLFRYKISNFITGLSLHSRYNRGFLRIRNPWLANMKKIIILLFCCGDMLVFFIVYNPILMEVILFTVMHFISEWPRNKSWSAIKQNANTCIWIIHREKHTYLGIHVIIIFSYLRATLNVHTLIKKKNEFYALYTMHLDMTSFI